MAEREESNLIDELMDEWDYSEARNVLTFQQWLKENHPENLEMVERRLGPDRPFISNHEPGGLNELRQVERLLGKWKDQAVNESSVFRDWVRQNHPEKLKIIERILGPDPRTSKL